MQRGKTLNKRTPDIDRLGVLMYNGGMRTTDIAAQLGIGHGTVYNILDDFGIEYPIKGHKHKITVVYCHECRYHGDCHLEIHDIKYCGRGTHQ